MVPHMLSSLCLVEQLLSPVGLPPVHPPKPCLDWTVSSKCIFKPFGTYSSLKLPIFSPHNILDVSLLEHQGLAGWLGWLTACLSSTGYEFSLTECMLNKPTKITLVLCSYNPTVAEVEAGKPLGSLSGQPRLFGKFQASERPCLKFMCEKCLRNNSQGDPLVSTCMLHVYKYTPK